MGKMISRRDFIKNSTLFFFSWQYFPGNNRGMLRQFTNETFNENLLGRILFDRTPTYSQPDIQSTQNRYFQFNDVIQVSQPIHINGQPNNHNTWFRIDSNAFVQSKDIQIVQNKLNHPMENISTSGKLAVVTVPFTEAWPRSKESPYPHQIFFYGSTHWVYGLGKNREGELFYLVKEDRWGESFYVAVAHLHIVADEELNPISPKIGVDRKRVLVDTKKQILTAFEDNQPVMISPISSGKFSTEINLITPIGEYKINYKRPSRHMVHSDKIGINDSELYGVPWVSYFTDTGIAFHGTYWHNDFSKPQSHGCVNMPIHAAKWLYLWTDPVVPPGEKKFVSKYGTHVKVI